MKMYLRSCCVPALLPVRSNALIGERALRSATLCRLPAAAPVYSRQEACWQSDSAGKAYTYIHTYNIDT